MNFKIPDYYNTPPLGVIGILFDVDNVLIDSERLYFEAVNETLRPYGERISEQEYIDRFLLDKTGSPGLIADYGLEVTVADMKATKREIVRRIMNEKLELMPGAEEILDWAEGKYRIGTVTSADRKEYEIKLGKLVSLDRFKVSITEDDFTNNKPDPEPYQKGCQGLELEPSRVLAIEDNPQGVFSAFLAGCKVIAYPNGFTKNMDFPYADRTVSSLDEIRDGLVSSL